MLKTAAWIGLSHLFKLSTGCNVQVPCDLLNRKQIFAEESSNNLQPKAFWLSDD